MHNGRGYALLRCTIHVPPVTAALALVVLNVHQYFIGSELAGRSGQDYEKLGALQFTAKLHELLMLASIGTVLFTYIRWELAYGEGVPLGAVFAGLQFDSISLLWSSEFLGTIYAKFGSRHKKSFLILIIIVCTLLGVSVGPSTANLMRPREDNWPAGGTTFWINASHDLVSPTFIDSSTALARCMTDTGDVSCPYGNWQILSQAFFSFWPQLAPQGTMPETLLIPGKFSERQLSVRHRSINGSEASLYGGALTLATVPPSGISDGVSELGRLWTLAANNLGHGRFNFEKDATFTVTVPQPMTLAYCTASVWDQDITGDDTVDLEFPVLSSIHFGSNALVVPGYLGETVPYNNTTTQVKVELLLSSDEPPNLTWIDSPSLTGQSNSTINVVATFPASEATLGLPSYYSCSIDSKLAQTQIAGTHALKKVVTGAPDDWTEKGTLNPAYSRIGINTEWAQYLNPKNPGEPNSTIFSRMAADAGMWNATVMSEAYNFPFIVESILATMVANGLSRTTYDAGLIGNLIDNWITEILPKNPLGYGSGTIYNVAADDIKNATMFTMKATANGYAYSSRGMLQKSAIAVLLFYSAFALSHVGYSLWTGWTATAWDTVPEIVALAMNSTKTQALDNTGAGVETIGVYEEKVRVKVRDDNLEFVFKDTNDEETGTIVRSRAYG
jgi:hypothetical protein